MEAVVGAETVELGGPELADQLLVEQLDVDLLVLTRDEVSEVELQGVFKDTIIKPYLGIWIFI